MLDRLESIVNNFLEIESKLASPDIMKDMESYTALSRKHSELSEIVTKYREFKETKQHLKEARELIKGGDPEMKELAQIEYQELSERLPQMEEQLKMLLIPKDPDDDKNVIMEIRQGTGGEEAAIFVANLYEMYSRYAEKKGWSLDVISMNEADQGGLKEVVATISGKSVYGLMKFESGIHRVQRVPKTEASGRIHTSAATVAIILETEEIEIDINPSDLRVDTYRASGSGGQHVNKTDSAVRITHIPTGIVSACQKERSQLQNRETAMKVLKAKIKEKELAEQSSNESALRKSQVGSGDRSEKIRTYNFPQSRVTDHRISLTVHNLNEVLNGDLGEILDALMQSQRLEKLKDLS